MTECGEVWSDCCMAALQAIRAMSFSDNESSRACKRGCSSSIDSSSEEEEDETLPLHEFAPGFGWRSPYSGDYFILPIGPKRHYNSWLPQWKHHCTCMPIMCPEFPSVSDEDLFWLLYLTQRCRDYFGMELTEDERNLHRWSVVLLSEWAVK